jgi:predicted RNA-binding Zn-ribbon protein involved in translation (DUF1610 family)
MDRIEHLIKTLDSPKSSARYDACELLRVAPSLNDAAVAALERASNDPDPEVRDAAQRALDLHRTARKTDATPDDVTLSCPSCGGGMAIAGDIDHFACALCGAEQVVTRAGDFVLLELAGADLPQVRTGADKRAAEQALPDLFTELAALEEEKGQLDAMMPKRFSGSTVIGQFLLAVVVAVATVPAMPSGTNPSVAFIVGAAVFFFLFAIHLYRYRRANLEQVLRIQKVTAGLDEQIRLKREEIKAQAIVPVRVGARKPERAAMAGLEKESDTLEENQDNSTLPTIFGVRRRQVAVAYWVTMLAVGAAIAALALPALNYNGEICPGFPIEPSEYYLRLLPATLLAAALGAVLGGLTASGEIGGREGCAFAAVVVGLVGCVLFNLLLASGGLPPGC